MDKLRSSGLNAVIWPCFHSLYQISPVPCLHTAWVFLTKVKARIRTSDAYNRTGKYAALPREAHSKPTVYIDSRIRKDSLKNEPVCVINTRGNVVPDCAALPCV
uniref:Uncharacterized protein n=1 Tax=Trichobilharzia regenti TaxID=157069 RepID=A0AA85J864_TRIRE|nr:unnamed protein product [Trichobilharzia regenti]